MSINIKIQDWRDFTPDEKALDVPEMRGRVGIGYRVGMGRKEIYDANHGYYTLNRRRASGEWLATWSYRDAIVCVAQVHSIVEVTDHRGRPKYVIVGAVVPPDDENLGWKYRDAVSPSRNPVTYEKDNVPQRTLNLFAHMRPFRCTCGCEQEVDVPGFAPGHAQKALTREITDIFGSIEIFVSVVRDAKYRRQIVQIVDDASAAARATPEEIAEMEEDHHVEQWDLEMKVYDE